MFQQMLMRAISASKPVVVELGAVLEDNTRSGGPCTQGIKIDSDGDFYVSDNVGSYGAASETWLERGTTSQVWVERTIDTGSLDTDDIGASRVACTSDLELIVVRPTSGDQQATGSLRFYNAPTGGTLLETTSWDIKATRT
ncbi:hypothetical protein LCGC14_1837800 [marine sediment metagenome]|uniref:Uncharacterized protein n=1 Tax=marine sediment metagenome TaxID=412755 RepID=A0A0F9GE57_9ZZZZ